MFAILCVNAREREKAFMDRTEISVEILELKRNRAIQFSV